MSLFGRQDGKQGEKPEARPFGRQREGESGERPAGLERAAARGAAGPAELPQGPSPAGEGGRRGGSDVANIGKSISIKGDLTGNEDIVIEGKVEGKVELPNNQLTIGANGQVKAEINAKGVIVVGRVSGNVRGTERVEIQATGVVEGDVSAPRLVIAEGAVVNGSIRMSKEAGMGKEGAAAAPPKPAPEPVRRIG
jgi:cytoskeletal protein CcmA (bactofilin family)